MDQHGTWSGRSVRVTPKWYYEAMLDRIREIDWDIARADVRHFIMAKEMDSLSAWNRELFLQALDQLINLM